MLKFLNGLGPSDGQVWKISTPAPAAAPTHLI